MEKQKQDTINLLLKKQAKKSKPNEKQEILEQKLLQELKKDKIKYVQKSNGEKLLHLPIGFTLTLGANKPRDIKVVENCCIEGCVDLKKYTHSRTGDAVCSLDHYKLIK